MINCHNMERVAGHDNSVQRDQHTRDVRTNKVSLGMTRSGFSYYIKIKYVGRALYCLHAIATIYMAMNS